MVASVEHQAEPCESNGYATHQNDIDANEPSSFANPNLHKCMENSNDFTAAVRLRAFLRMDYNRCLNYGRTSTNYPVCTKIRFTAALDYLGL